MDTNVAPDPIAALAVQRGHFRLESGLHADRWIELDALLVDPTALAPQVDALVALLAPYRPTAICGPLIGGAFVAQSVATRIGVHFYFTERIATAHTAASSGRLFEARYALPHGLRRSAARERFAVVDDVLSTGSSARATVDALKRVGASTEVIGALMVLGERAVEHFASVNLPLVSRRFEAFDCWVPADCPLCAKGIALDVRG